MNSEVEKKSFGVLRFVIQYSIFILFSFSAFAQELHCSFCNKPISPKAVYYTYQDSLSACNVCTRKVKMCSSCGRLSISCVAISEKLSVCENCYAQRVKTVEEASVLMDTVLQWMESNLGLEVKHKIECRLVKQDKMPRLGGRDETSVGLFVVEDGKFYLYVAYGFQPFSLRVTLAHELTHAWQVENAVMNQSLSVREGFAEWVAYKYAEWLGNTAEMKNIDTNLVREYVEGFHYFRKIETDRGQAETISRAKTMTRLK